MPLRAEQSALVRFDWPLLGLVLFISAVGVLTIYSATRPLPGEPHPGFYARQAVWLLLGLIGLVASAAVDYRHLNRWAYVLFAIGIVLLLAVFLAGRTGMGAKRWLTLGPVSFQPSEPFKLALLLVMARYLSRMEGRLTLRSAAGVGVLILLVPLLLVLRQPDLGTAVVLVLLFAFMVLAKGIARKSAVLLLVIALVSVPFVGGIVWDQLKDYQKRRIVAFLNPGSDPGGSGYHVTQSKVAVGSGGAFGKGFMRGTQGPLRFLPEKHTDFIFSIFAEEWGFLGSIVLLGAYLLLLLRGVATASLAKDEFGRLLSLGVVFMFSIYLVVNVGMTVGLMPVVGLPLPFMSYGGTALVTNCIAAGLLVNVRLRRFDFV